MKPARSLIPIGTATLLPDTARRVRRLEEQLLADLACWGYREIILPTFEYLDVLSVGLAPEVLEKCYKFADWTTGRILVLRPDITAQIARIVAMDMGGGGLPLRLSYRTTVFRYEPEHAGREREVFQVGVELIGSDDAYSDTEILILLMESLRNIGLPEFKISLGHVGFFKALLIQSGLSDEGRKQAEFAVAHKDLPRLEHIMSKEKISRKKARVILEAAGRCGQQDVLEWGRAVAGRDMVLKQPLERLAKVHELLDLAGFKEHILIDLGEFRGFDYYDGVVFDVFTASLGFELGGGGRYDHLLGKFGRNLPSTGFGLDMDRVFAALDPNGSQINSTKLPVLVVGLEKNYGQAFRLSQRLRSEGIHVIQEVLRNDKGKLVPLACARAKKLGVSRVIIFEPTHRPHESVELVDCSSHLKRPRVSKVKCRVLSDVLKASC